MRSPEIVLIVGGVVVRMDAVRPKCLGSGELDFQPLVTQGEIGSKDMPPNGIVGMRHGV